MYSNVLIFTFFIHMNIWWSINTHAIWKEADKVLNTIPWYCAKDLRWSYDNYMSAKWMLWSGMNGMNWIYAEDINSKNAL